MKIVPNIEVGFQEKFPKNYVNDIDGWAFPKKKLEERLNDGTNKLLTLDIDFGTYCSLACPHCFRDENAVDFMGRRIMSYGETIGVIKQGKELGLESVKFLGAGEPFEDKRLLEFLSVLHTMEIKPLIFTKGHVIGDNALSQKYFGLSPEKLVERLKEYGARIMLGFNSFDTAKQDKMVGNVEGYTLKRNNALELLVNAGFNKPNPTHLALALNPVTNENYAEIFAMYTFARERNMYAIVCPTMVSGKCTNNAWKKITPSAEKLVELYTKIYRWNIEKGLQTLEQIKEEGIAAYAGGAPCNQVACGMYVTSRGIVLRCPGDDVTVFGDIREKPLKEIWVNSENYKRAGTFNCGCPPKDGLSIPSELYSKVIGNLIK